MTDNLEIIVTDQAESSFGSAIQRALAHFRNRIQNRCPVFFHRGQDGFSLLISFDEKMEGDGFCLESGKNGCVLSASTIQGILAGLGKYLRTSQYEATGMIPSEWEGISVPTGKLRGVQMDSHFCNFYHMAPKEELGEYVADLAFWGVNYLDVVFPIIDLTGWDDPELWHITEQIKAIFTEAKALGIKVGIEIVPNQDFVNSRKEYAAIPNVEPVRRRGNNGHNMCPNKLGALSYMTELYTQVVRFLDSQGLRMDFLCFWPYDEGGCGCEKCRPWGSNGYLKASRSICEKVKEINPDIEVILSTWLFDCHQNDGEWEGLAEEMEKDHSWVDYIMADSHTDFPKFPLTHPVPGNLPLINYPEISMWGLFPWGGYGANPLPKRFERLWNQVKTIAKGGITYSEGCFDDMNKVVCTQFYWEADTTSEQTLREYFSYEMSPRVTEELIKVVNTIEELHVATVVDNSRAITREANVLSVTEDICRKAEENLCLINEIKQALPSWASSGWRFRLLYDRVKLDQLRYTLAYERRGSLTEKSAWFDALKGSKEAIEVLKDVVAINHSPLIYDDKNHPMYCVVRPPLREVEGSATNDA